MIASSKGIATAAVVSRTVRFDFFELIKHRQKRWSARDTRPGWNRGESGVDGLFELGDFLGDGRIIRLHAQGKLQILQGAGEVFADRKSTRLNSSHVRSSYAVFCLK